MSLPQPPADAPVEGVDGTVVRYRERLTAPVWAWAALLFVTGSLGLAYGYAIGTRGGLLAFGVSTGLAAWGLLASASVVQVDDRVVRAGRARLPLAFVGQATALDATAARDLRGPGADARAFLALRPFVVTAVRIDQADPRDPHPYWLVSTRRPQELAAAVALAVAGEAGRDR